MIAYWSIALAFAWAAITGIATLWNLMAGFAVSWLVVTWLRRGPGASPLTRVWRLLGLCGYFLMELVIANVRIAYDIVTPRHHMKPAVIGIPLEARTDAEITLLANLISLTPGTLSLDVSADRKTLYVHTMYLDDRDELVNRIKSGFEYRLLRVMR
jgi:multicomponent Na+:H+ antiporter subunit E